jgi:hypothetical protein
MMKVGSCSDFGYKPRQDRKVAAVSSLELCAGKPDWSFYPLSPFRLKANLPHDRMLEAQLINNQMVRLVNVFIEL